MSSRAVAPGVEVRRYERRDGTVTESAAAAARSSARCDSPELRALFVRLPAAEFDDLARAAFELGVRKRELVGALIRAYVDPHTQQRQKQTSLARSSRPARGGRRGTGAGALTGKPFGGGRDRSRSSSTSAS